jgi:hypothetical protein
MRPWIIHAKGSRANFLNVNFTGISLRGTVAARLLCGHVTFGAAFRARLQNPFFTIDFDFLRAAGFQPGFGRWLCLW